MKKILFANLAQLEASHPPLHRHALLFAGHALQLHCSHAVGLHWQASSVDFSNCACRNCSVLEPCDKLYGLSLAFGGSFAKLAPTPSQGFGLHRSQHRQDASKCAAHFPVYTGVESASIQAYKHASKKLLQTHRTLSKTPLGDLA